MMLNSGAVLFQWQPPPSSRSFKTLCFASTPSSMADQLRQQLDCLHKEADHARIKANSARSRLMRLSEAAEKLRRQAAVSVQTGKENDARDLLFQKKMVMQAMEKLKSRIELFDELSTKLNEAISMKENQLIGNMELDVEVTENGPSTVHIISPKLEYPNNSDSNQFDLNSPKVEQDQELQVSAKNQEEIHGNTISKESSSDAENICVPNEMSAYEDFMKDIDKQLNKIEEELEMFLRFSNLLLESKENPEYSKVRHVMEILESVRCTRERIANILQTTMSSSPL